VLSKPGLGPRLLDKAHDAFMPGVYWDLSRNVVFLAAPSILEAKFGRETRFAGEPRGLFAAARHDFSASLPPYARGLRKRKWLFSETAK
jgi:hypothetical protein